MYEFSLLLHNGITSMKLGCRLFVYVSAVCDFYASIFEQTPDARDQDFNILQVSCASCRWHLQHMSTRRYSGEFWACVPCAQNGWITQGFGCFPRLQECLWHSSFYTVCSVSVIDMSLGPRSCHHLTGFPTCRYQDWQSREHIDLCEGTKIKTSIRSVYTACSHLTQIVRTLSVWWWWVKWPNSLKRTLFSQWDLTAYWNFTQAKFLSIFNTDNGSAGIVFTNVTFDQHQIDSASTPCSDFYFRCDRTPKFEDLDLEGSSPTIAEAAVAEGESHLLALEKALAVDLTLIVLWKVSAGQDWHDLVRKYRMSVLLARCTEKNYKVEWKTDRKRKMFGQVTEGKKKLTAD